MFKCNIFNVNFKFKCISILHIVAHTGGRRGLKSQNPPPEMSSFIQFYNRILQTI